MKLFTGRNKELLLKTGSAVLAVVLWQAVAMCVGNRLLLATPLQVAGRLFTLLGEGDFWSSVLFSMLRILLGFLLAALTGLLAGLAAGRFHALEILLKPYVTVMKSVPVASFIILFLLWLSFSQLTVFIAFLIAFPVIYSNVLQGVKNVSRQMHEMADVFAIKGTRRLLYITMPAVKPFFISACSVAMGMAWKAGVAAEVIGLIGGSIGEKLYNAKIYFQNAELLAWTLVIILLSLIGEKLCTLILKGIFKGLEKL